MQQQNYINILKSVAPERDITLDAWLCKKVLRTAILLGTIKKVLWNKWIYYEIANISQFCCKADFIE